MRVHRQRRDGSRLNAAKMGSARNAPANTKRQPTYVGGDARAASTHAMAIPAAPQSRLLSYQGGRSPTDREDEAAPKGSPRPWGRKGRRSESRNRRIHDAPGDPMPPAYHWRIRSTVSRANVALPHEGWYARLSQCRPATRAARSTDPSPGGAVVRFAVHAHGRSRTPTRPCASGDSRGPRGLSEPARTASPNAVTLVRCVHSAR